MGKGLLTILIFSLLALPVVYANKPLKSVSLVDCEQVDCTPILVADNDSSDNLKAKLKVKKATRSDKAQVLNRESMTLEEQQAYFSRSKWNFVLGTGVYRTLDELSDYYSNYSISGNYQFRPGIFFNFSTGYSSIIYQDGGSFLVNNQSASAEKYGLSDLTLGISLPGYLSLKKINSILTFGSDLRLPLSQASRDTSMHASLTTYAQLRTRLSRRWMSSFTSSLILANYTYDDADVFGYQVNSPLGLSNSIGLNYNFWRNLTAYGSYGLYHRYDYEGYIDNIQTISTGILVPATQKLYINFGYMWRDRVITNDRLFDNNKSYYSLGVSYSI